MRAAEAIARLRELGSSVVADSLRDIGHPEVGVGVVGRHAPLVGEPHGRPAPVAVVAGCDLKRALRRGPARERDLAPRLGHRHEPVGDHGGGVLDDADLPHPDES